MKSIGELPELLGLRLKSFHGMSLENFQLLNYISKVKQLVSLIYVYVLMSVKYSVKRKLKEKVGSTLRQTSSSAIISSLLSLKYDQTVI